MGDDELTFEDITRAPISSSENPAREKEVLPKSKARVPWQEKMASTGYGLTASASRKGTAGGDQFNVCQVREHSTVLRAAHCLTTTGAHAGTRATYKVQCSVQDDDQPRSRTKVRSKLSA
jgi:hypothetical protein